jgi:hypothetical protein
VRTPQDRSSVQLHMNILSTAAAVLQIYNKDLKCGLSVAATKKRRAERQTLGRRK